MSTLSLRLPDSLHEQIKKVLNMKITSPDFKPNGFIPKKFTCEGENFNPNLVLRITKYRNGNKIF